MVNYLSQNRVIRVDSWGNFLSERINAMYKSTQYCDITLRFPERDLMAHSLILHSCTTFFKDLFRNKPLGPKVLKMPSQIDANSMEAVLNFIYTGCLDANIEAKSLLTTATALKLDILVKILSLQIDQDVAECHTDSGLLMMKRRKLIMPKFSLSSSNYKKLPTRKLLRKIDTSYCGKPSRFNMFDSTNRSDILSSQLINDDELGYLDKNYLFHSTCSNSFKYVSEMDEIRDNSTKPTNETMEGWERFTVQPSSPGLNACSDTTRTSLSGTTSLPCLSSGSSQTTPCILSTSILQPRDIQQSHLDIRCWSDVDSDKCHDSSRTCDHSVSQAFTQSSPPSHTYSVCTSTAHAPCTPFSTYLRHKTSHPLSSHRRVRDQSADCSPNIDHTLFDDDVISTSSSVFDLADSSSRTTETDSVISFHSMTMDRDTVSMLSNTTVDLTSHPTHASIQPDDIVSLSLVPIQWENGEMSYITVQPSFDIV